MEGKNDNNDKHLHRVHDLVAGYQECPTHNELQNEMLREIKREKNMENFKTLFPLSTLVMPLHLSRDSILSLN